MQWRTVNLRREVCRPQPLLAGLYQGRVSSRAFKSGLDVS